MSNKNRISADKRIYYFGAKLTEGHQGMRDLLGGKGANLAEMTSIGLPVPPGFTITTATCADFEQRRLKLPVGLIGEIKSNMRRLEKEMHKQFGDTQNPLLVSVRSGAAVSMPGMMDTILNLGLTDKTVAGLSEQTGNPRFALDAYRRLINMFGDVVMGVDHHHFEKEFALIKKRHGAIEDTDLDVSGLNELIDTYKEIYKKHAGENFPQDPYVQLEKAVEAVFLSWNIPRAITYRRINDIRGLLGTAVNIQSMVFGNMGKDSGTETNKNRNSADKRIYYFGAKLTEGHQGMRDLLGGKGANLAEMTSIGLPVPPGFTITTATCADFEQRRLKLPVGLIGEIKSNMRRLEKEIRLSAGKRYP